MNNLLMLIAPIAIVLIPAIIIIAVLNYRSVNKKQEPTDEPELVQHNDRDPVQRKIADMFEMLDQLRLGQFSKQDKKVIERQPPISAAGVTARRMAMIDNMKRDEGNSGTARENIRHGVRDDQRSGRRHELQGDSGADDHDRVSDESLVSEEPHRTSNAKVCNADLRTERDEANGGGITKDREGPEVSGCDE